MRCDLIIPAFNEAPNIEALFDALEPVREHVRDVVLADNGSTDGTGETACPVRLDPRQHRLVGHDLVSIRSVDGHRPVFANHAQRFDHRQGHLDRFGLAVK